MCLLLSRFPCLLQKQPWPISIIPLKVCCSIGHQAINSLHQAFESCKLRSGFFMDWIFQTFHVTVHVILLKVPGADFQRDRPRSLLHAKCKQLPHSDDVHHTAITLFQMLHLHITCNNILWPHTRSCFSVPQTIWTILQWHCSHYPAEKGCCYQGILFP